MRWMEIAWADLGVKEIAGSDAEPKILAYFRNAGRSDITSDEVPWCAAFVNACLSRAGISLDPIPRDDRLLARKCLLLGTPIDAPRIGAIAVFARGGDPTYGHVGFVNGWTDTHVQLLGGNQANSVSIELKRRADVIGYRWPEAPATAKELAAKGSRIAAAAQRQQKDAAKATGTGGGGQVVPAAPDVVPPKTGAGELLQKASGFRGWFETAESLAMFAWSKFPWIAAAIAAYFGGRMIYDAWIIKHARVEDANEGWSPVVSPEPQEAADGVL